VLDIARGRDDQARFHSALLSPEIPVIALPRSCASRHEPELELKRPYVAQRPVLWGKAGARAWRICGQTMPVAARVALHSMQLVCLFRIFFLLGAG